MVLDHLSVLCSGAIPFSKYLAGSRDPAKDKVKDNHPEARRSSSTSKQTANPEQERTRTYARGSRQSCVCIDVTNRSRSAKCRVEDQIEIDNDISIINQYHHLISHQPARVSPFQGSSSDGSVGPVTRQARRRQPPPHNSNVCVYVPVTPCYCRYVSNSYSHPPVPCANG